MERVLAEMSKLLLKGRLVNQGLRFLDRVGAVVQLFPELHALKGVPQDPEWHPEGDVWTHTTLVAQAASGLREEASHPRQLMWAALLHDLGKVGTTVQDPDGHIRSRGHEDAGIVLARTMLGRLKAPSALVEAVGLLVGRHLAPVHFEGAEGQPASDKAYRRLARALAQGGSDLDTLWRVAEADHLGRGQQQRISPHGNAFRERCRALNVEKVPRPPAVLGRHLLARGFTPGPEIGQILRACLHIQDSSGVEDPEAILDMALSRK